MKVEKLHSVTLTTTLLTIKQY